VIEDATGARIAVLAVSGPGDAETGADAHQFVKSANAFDALTTVCETLLVLVNATSYDQWFNVAGDALEQARAILAEMEAAE
jgi:hypothetical protein